MAVYLFGSGILWVTPLVDATGTTITAPTPQRLGALQDMAISIDLPTKELYGTNYFPLAVGRGTGKVGVKTKFAQVNMGVLNSLYFAEPTSPVVGGATQLLIVNDEAATASTSTFTISKAANCSSGNPLVDLGVRWASGANAGQAFKKVATPTLTGTYSVVLTTGVYTLSGTDASAKVVVDYGYSINAGTALSIQMGNHALGVSPSFQAFGKVQWGAGALQFQFNNCVSSKFSIPTKLDGFVITELDFDCFVDNSGNLGILTSSEF